MLITEIWLYVRIWQAQNMVDSQIILRKYITSVSYYKLCGM